MGKIEVIGEAKRSVEKDIMKMVISFCADEDTSDAASKKVMDECEAFLVKLKEIGLDISKICIKKDEVDRDTRYYHRNDDDKTYYRGIREIEITTSFDMKLLNGIRVILNEQMPDVGFDVSYQLSNEEEIRKQLLVEALKNAEQKAEAIAKALNRRVVDFVSADKKMPDRRYENDEKGMYMVCEQERPVSGYDCSNELNATMSILSEDIHTVWKIAY